MKKVISLITVISLLSCLTVSASADASWFNGLQLTSQIKTISGNLPTYCNGSIVFNAKHVDSNIEVSISCRSYDVCLLENVITQNCLSKNKCVTDFGYCSNSNYNNGNGSNGENGNGNNNNGNNNNNNPPYVPPQEPKEPPKEEPKNEYEPLEYQCVTLEDNFDNSNIQIRASLATSNSKEKGSYTISQDGNTRIYDVKLSNITPNSYSRAIFVPEYYTAYRCINFRYTNKNNYPIKISWFADAIKLSNMAFPLYSDSYVEWQTLGGDIKDNGNGKDFYNPAYCYSLDGSNIVKYFNCRGGTHPQFINFGFKNFLSKVISFGLDVPYFNSMSNTVPKSGYTIVPINDDFPMAGREEIGIPVGFDFIIPYGTIGETDITIDLKVERA